MSDERRTLTVQTPLGEIKAVDAGYENSIGSYPGIWVEVNGEGLALVEFDASSQRLMIRVWDSKDPDNDPIYTQAVELPEREEE